MAISLKTQKMLWGRAANRCAICKKELVIDATETDDESLIGEACHIVAQSENGPRGISPLTLEERDKFANLILLCNLDHKVVDDQYLANPVEHLIAIKAEHENWVKLTLNFDPRKQHDEEVYADYIETWESYIQLDKWDVWTSWLLGHGQPALYDSPKKQLEEIQPWLLSRVWPKRYPEIEQAFLNFRRVCQDLTSTFNEHAEFQGDIWRTRKFYKIDQWNPDLYRRLANDFHEHVSLVEDLTLELTRAANLICDAVRANLLPSYRLKEGVLLVLSGPNWDFSFTTYRVEYQGEERNGHAYTNLQNFKKDRFSRDIFFGEPPKVDHAAEPKL